MKRWEMMIELCQKNEERLTVLVVSEKLTEGAMIRRERSKKSVEKSTVKSEKVTLDVMQNVRVF